MPRGISQGPTKFSWLAAVVLTVALAVPAHASRALLDGYGLPRLLRVDQSTLSLFPGSTAGFQAQGLIEYGASATSLYQYDGAAFTDPATSTAPLGLALVGSGAKFGYLLDGRSHNAILARGGLGLTLGFQDAYRENSRQYESETSYDDRVSKLSERSFRAALGAQHTTESGRVWELSIGGRLSQAEGESKNVSLRSYGNSSEASSWEDQDALGAEVAARTVTNANGLLIAGTFYYQEFNPVVTFSNEIVQGTADVTFIRRGASLSLGYRLSAASVQEVIVGVFGSWTDETDPDIYSSEVLYLDRNQVYQGGIFLALEQPIIQRLVARAGVNGGASFRTDTVTRMDLSADQVTLQEDKVSTGQTLSPRVHLGISWSWKALIMDARVSENLSLSNPVARWALTIPI